MSPGCCGDRNRRLAEGRPLQALAEIRIPYNAALYKPRNRIERRFDKLKHIRIRAVATPFDRRVTSFLVFMHFASAAIAAPASVAPYWGPPRTPVGEP
jgi:transposase